MAKARQEGSKKAIICAWFAVGWPLVSALPVLAQGHHSEHPLLAVEKVSPDISNVTVTNEQGVAQVYIDGSGVPAAANVKVPRDWNPGRPLENLKLAVWLLRKDGTVAKPAGSSGDIGGRTSGGWSVPSAVFQFERTQSADIAGVVIRADGKLYAWAIPTK